MNNRLDFAHINREALSHLRDLVEKITGETGIIQGRELLIRNPRRDDSKAGSFSINLDKGVWVDFASGDGGSDSVSLVAFLQGHDNQGEAARWIAGELDLQADAAPGPRKPAPAPPAFPRPLAVVPADALPLPRQQNEEGRWEWRNASGELLKVTIRIPGAIREKKVLPWTWCELAPGRFDWRQKDLPDPRPLFGLDRLATRPGAPVLVVEGEKTALAAEQVFPDYVAVTSGSCQSAGKADWGPLQGRAVTIWPDADEPGQGYAVAVMKALKTVSVESLRTVKTANLPPKWDLADELPPGMDFLERTERLNRAPAVDLRFPNSESTPEAGPAASRNRAGCYLIHEGRMSMEGREGAPQHLCNFTARIREEVVLDDGENEDLLFLVEGSLASGEPLPLARVPAGAFSGMAWVMSQWGARAVINAGSTKKDHLRTAIQNLSTPSRRRSYLNTGWRKLDGQWCYLHAGGAIGPDGPMDGVETDLNGNLALFTLAAPLQGAELARAFRSSCRALDLGPETVTAPVWLSPFRAVADECPFSIHISGAKGTGKTEMASIATGHFGPKIDARTPLDSWESTVSNLERTLFLGKDVLGLVDDFRPGDSQKAQHDMASKTDRIFRSAFNRHTRGRLAQDSRTQKRCNTPRALILSTGEDTLKGESLTSRVLCLEWPAGAMAWAVLDGLQKDREQGLHAGLLAAFIQWQAKDRERAQALRKQAHEQARDKMRAAGENNRTAGIAADLWSVWPALEVFALESGIMPAVELQRIGRRIWSALCKMAGAQAELIKEQNPVHRFKEGLTAYLSSGRGYLANGELGALPVEWEESCGWNDGAEPINRIKLGHLAPKRGEVWLIPSTAYMEANKQTPIQVGEKALWKHLRDAGVLVLERAGRNEARRTLPSGGRSTFIVLRMEYLWDLGQSEAVGQSEKTTVPAQSTAGTTSGTNGTNGTQETYTPPTIFDGVVSLDPVEV